MNTPITENKLFLPVSVIVAGLLIAGAVVWSDSRPSTAVAPVAGGQGPVAGTVDIKNVNLDGKPFIGKPNAPITIALWGDYQCVFCKKFETETLPQLIRDYVDKGKVKIVFLDFPFLGEDSLTAAVYGRSVWKLYPAQYFAWRTAMYKAEDGSGDQGFGDSSSIDALNATVAGLDSARISADVKANKAVYEAAANEDRAEGQKHGISATPSFIIGTELIQGAYPYATFQTALDALL